MSSDSNHSFAENNQAMEEGEVMEDDEAMEQVDMALMIDDVEGTRRRNAEGHTLLGNDNTRIGMEQSPPHAPGNITLAQPQSSNTRIWMEQATSQPILRQSHSAASRDLRPRDTRPHKRLRQSSPSDSVQSQKDINISAIVC